MSPDPLAIPSPLWTRKLLQVQPPRLILGPHPPFGFLTQSSNWLFLPCGQRQPFLIASLLPACLLCAGCLPLTLLGGLAYRSSQNHPHMQVLPQGVHRGVLVLFSLPLPLLSNIDYPWAPCPDALRPPPTTFPRGHWQVQHIPTWDHSLPLFHLGLSLHLPHP